MDLVSRDLIKPYSMSWYEYRLVLYRHQSACSATLTAVSEAAANAKGISSSWPHLIERLWTI